MHGFNFASENSYPGKGVYHIWRKATPFNFRPLRPLSKNFDTVRLLSRIDASSMVILMDCINMRHTVLLFGSEFISMSTRPVKIFKIFIDFDQKFSDKNLLIAMVEHVKGFSEYHENPSI